MDDTVDPRLLAHADVWGRKASLRAVYGDYYFRMLGALPPKGKYLEIGAGSGHSRDFTKGRDITRLDILPAPWVDTVADAQSLPFPDESFDGIFLLDVLHHLAEPRKFFEEAARVLRPGGRIAMIEPGITPISWLFYNYLHEEPVDMIADPLADQHYGADKDPFDSNQGIPTLLFRRQEHRIALSEAVPALRTVDRQWLSLFAYPLTGGFKSWSLIPAGLADFLVRLEDRLLPALGLLMAFRLFVVMEKRP
ncbi:class I SAM-dependent methyltransferase [Rhodospirillaceae bacterium KN72]|uniref:Class I SAM-dependent methyltransferase n=1 Tax=Pacificispira spongiicola TaxID=2729598 RepID=A0A7Y0DX06_9PROT|nr:class I SAM-dependent methyltransferase [Pacificispira spongiicola]NMM43153.1 class I SAM-dependent methyltransferase [Pacificispira spongiicola]